MTDTRTHDYRFPAEPALRRLLAVVLPGSSQSTIDLREAVLGAIGDLSARSILLLGPIGIGKTSLARIIAFGKRIAPLLLDKAERRIEDARFEAPGFLDLRTMPWYVELPLTGLVESLAESQLFGTTKAAYTGAVTRPGVFESAASGRGGDPDGGAGVTGGVVFLDEIGDLAPSLQAKLLPVLAGGSFYRIGGEGDDRYEKSFEGTVISATWRDPLAGRVRPDLLARLSGAVIRVPGLGPRREDLDLLVTSIEKRVLKQLDATIERIKTTDPDTDREFYERMRKAREQLARADRKRLLAIDWSTHGQLRGLTQTIERVLIGTQSVDQALAERAVTSNDDGAPIGAIDELTRWLQGRRPDGSGLAAHVKAFERGLRSRLSAHVRRDENLLTELAATLEIEPQRLRAQVRELSRSRRLPDLDGAD